MTVWPNESGTTYYVAVAQHAEALLFEEVHYRAEDGVVVAENEAREEALRREVEERRLEDERLRHRAGHDDVSHAALLHVVYRKAEVRLRYVHDVERVLRQLAYLLSYRIDDRRGSLVRQPARDGDGKKSFTGD